MKFVACDGDWLLVNGSLSCTGTLITVAQNEMPQQGLDPEDMGALIDHTMVLFALVFGFLALKKAIS